MKDTPVGQKETTVVEHPWPPEQGKWTYEDWLKLPDDGYRYEVIDGVLYMSPPPPAPLRPWAARMLCSWRGTV
jgi:hypothetical protein